MKQDLHESHAHFLAKQLLLGWLRDGHSLGKFSFTANRGEPFYGVFDEYPIDENFSTVWDEQGWWCNHKTDEQGNYHIDDEMCNSPDERTWPNYEWMKAHSKKNYKIADIAIQHKGSIIYLIEIVHKNPITEDKINFYKTAFEYNTPEVYEIPAHWILNRPDIPTEMPCVFRVL